MYNQYLIYKINIRKRIYKIKKDHIKILKIEIKLKSNFSTKTINFKINLLTYN